MTVNHVEVIADWLMDKFVIAGPVPGCRTEVDRIKKSGIQQIAIERLDGILGAKKFLAK